MDTFDLKPLAPKELRGEFAPISTKVPGMEICELMPRLASAADKMVLVRSVTGMTNEHNPSQSDSGWSEKDLKSLGGRPGVGAVLSKVYGPAITTTHGVAPTSVDLNKRAQAGYLGPMHMPYRPDGAAMQNLSMNKKVSETRFAERNELLTSFAASALTQTAKG